MVLPVSAETFSLLFRLAVAEWVTVAEARGGKTVEHDEFGSVVFSEPQNEGDGSVVAVTYNVEISLKHRGDQVVAVSTDGEVHRPERARIQLMGNRETRYEAHFPGLPLDQVAAFRLRFRSLAEPYEGVEFRNVFVPSSVHGSTDGGELGLKEEGSRDSIADVSLSLESPTEHQHRRRQIEVISGHLSRNIQLLRQYPHEIEYSIDVTLHAEGQKLLGHGPLVKSSPASIKTMSNVMVLKRYNKKYFLDRVTSSELVSGGGQTLHLALIWDGSTEYLVHYDRSGKLENSRVVVAERPAYFDLHGITKIPYNEISQAARIPRSNLYPADLGSYIRDNIEGFEYSDALDGKVTLLRNTPEGTRLEMVLDPRVGYQVVKVVGRGEGGGDAITTSTMSAEYQRVKTQDSHFWYPRKVDTKVLVELAEEGRKALLSNSKVNVSSVRLVDEDEFNASLRIDTNLARKVEYQASIERRLIN